jgi:hypothetical protein
LSVEELYDDDDDHLKTLDLMTQDEYVSQWQKIASSPNSAEGQNKKHFWQLLQDCLNETFNWVNVIIVGSLIVSLDVDKKKALIGKGKDMQGLKQHVLSDKESHHCSQCPLLCELQHC